jgi:hypothetical protein
MPPKPKVINKKRLYAIEPVKDLITEFPSFLVRKIASAVGVSTKIVQTIILQRFTLKTVQATEMS